MVDGVHTQAQVDLVLGSDSCPLLYTFVHFLQDMAHMHVGSWK